MKRKIVQIASLLALHSSFWANAQVKWLCNPVLSCHSCALAYFACPVGVFVHMSGWHAVSFIAIGTVVLVGVLVGRLLCGWVCPFGLLQSALYRIPSPKISLPVWTGYIKYVVLGLMAFLLPYLFGELTWFSFCRVCPAAALQVEVPGWFIDGFRWKGRLSTSRFALLAVILVFGVLSSRSFCKVLCPIGAMLAPFNHISFWKVHPPKHGCIDCGRCDSFCSTDVRPSDRLLAGVPPNRHHDCIVCHDCVTRCPAVKAAADGARPQEEEPASAA
ncbi:4Fe-4S binding protein [Candidatus Sumerlaeota bacterium]|nr:4Fe-4S binding protein [Candidatus Sumerlaeota bacterium]